MLLGNVWRAQEYMLLLGTLVAIVSLVHLSGGDSPWWANILTGFGVALLIDAAEGLGRRREQEGA